MTTVPGRSSRPATTRSSRVSRSWPRSATGRAGWPACHPGPVRCRGEHPRPPVPRPLGRPGDVHLRRRRPGQGPADPRAQALDERPMRFDRMITAVDAHAAGEPGRVITGGVLDVPGAHDAREDGPPARPRRRPAQADAARAARLPRRELQPDPAADDPRRRRRLRDHGAGRVPGHVRHEHDLRGHGPDRDGHGRR